MARKKSSKSRNTINKPKVAILGNDKKSGHLLTSRPYGSNQRFIVLIAYFILVLFAVMSVYAVSIAPTNAGAWGTFVLFFGFLVILLMYENNIFPDLGKRLPHSFGVLVLAFLSIPFLAATVNNFNIVTMIIGLTFMLPLILLLLVMFTPEEQWEKRKKNIKDKFKRKGKESAKKVKNKVAGVRGKNRNRKIYRR